MWTVLPCSQLWGWFTHPFSNRVGCIGLPKRGASSCCWPEFHHSTGKHTRTTCICSYGVQRTALGIILQNVTHLAWDRATHWPGTYQDVQASWWGISRDPPANLCLSSSGIINACCQTWPFMWVWGIEIGPSQLQGKHLMNWVVQPASKHRNFY